MDKCSMMLLAGPGSKFAGNEFRGEGLDDNCPAIDLVTSVRSCTVRRDWWLFFGYFPPCVMNYFMNVLTK